MSFDYYRRAQDCIAQASLTNSKRPECFIKGITPTHVTHGNGAWLFSPDGKKYLDFVCGLGSNLFGYANPYITNAVQSQLYKGTVYSLGSTLEVESAELVKGNFPFIQKLRFLKTGTEACMAAIRIARAHTERLKVLSSGYHGWSDSFISLTPPSLGVSLDKHIENFTSLDQIKTDVACVIIEPIMTDHSTKRLEWLKLVVEKCQKNGVLVIFDEIITGFRWPKLSFANDSGIYPDIILLGKACGGGFPLSIVGLGKGIGHGKEWFVSSTFAGDTIALTAMNKTFEVLKNIYKIDDLWREAGYFLEEFNELWPEKIKLEGYPTRSVFVGDELTKALFWQECARAGILVGSSFWFGFQHMEHRHFFLSSFKDIIQNIKTGSVKLLGEMPTSPFAQQLRRT